MHIELKPTNPLFIQFDKRRKAEGYTTVKSAIIAAMKMFMIQTSPVTDEKAELQEQIG